MSLFVVYAKALYLLRDFWPFLLLDVVFAVIFIVGLVVLFKLHVRDSLKKALMVLLTLVCFAVFIFTGFEAFFRYQYDESDSLGFLKVTGRWLERHVVSNNYRYRDRDFSAEKKQGVTRIGIVGDSMTFGYGIKNPEDRFSNLLEKKLLASGRNVEVYNLGKSGYDTWNEIGEFKNVQHLHFDIIVWQYFLNDAQPSNGKGSKVLIKEKSQGDFAKRITSFSYFLDYIYWRFQARYERTFQELRLADANAYRDEKNFAWHKSVVNDFANLLKQDKRKVIVVVIPFIKFLPENPLSDKYPEILDMFKKNNLPVIDMYNDLKHKNAKDVLVSRYDYHPNESVQVLIADRLYGKIAPLVPVSKK